MSLYNTFKNKNISFLINYINHCIEYPEDAITPEELREQLIGDSGLTYKEVIDELANTSSDHANRANIFYTDADNRLQPLRDVPIPIRASVPECAWLYYILDDPKVNLFLDKETIVSLKKALENSHQLDDFPLNSDSFTIIREQNVESQIYTAENIRNFRIILQAIREHRYITLDNNALNGNIYTGSKLIPYRFVYSYDIDSLSLSAFPADCDSEIRPIKINLTRISNARICEEIPNYDIYLKKCVSSQEAKKAPTPLTVKIADIHNGIDRSAYVLSAYERESYRDSDNNTIMKIRYYDFQRRGLLKKIISLGPCITILDPPEMISELKDMLKECLKLYSN